MQTEKRSTPYRKSILVKTKSNDDCGNVSDSLKLQLTKKAVTISTPEEEKSPSGDMRFAELSNPTPKTPFSNRVDKLKSKMESWESYWHYFVSYQIHNHDAFVEAYIKHGASVLQWIDIDSRDSLSFSKRSTRNRTGTLASMSIKDEIVLEDIRMEWWDRVPHIDRPNFPISHVIDLIPRLLFSKSELKIETSRSNKDEIRCTSIYLSSVGEYMHVAGLLTYEDLSQYQDAYANMRNHKQKREENDLKHRQLKSLLTYTPKAQIKSTSSTGTGSKQSLENLQFPDISLLRAEKSEGIHQNGLFGTDLLEIQENEDDFFSDSEEENADWESDQNSKKINLPDKAILEKQDSSNAITQHLKTLKKSESFTDNKTEGKRIKVPKILVLVSKYPIFEDMEEFLKKIKIGLTDCTSVPFESMILNLVYEFPHPGEKYLIHSNFWRSKKRPIFEYETPLSLPFWDPKYFLEFYNYQEKLHIIWSIIEKMLFNKQILLVSKSKSSLVAWSEILK